MMLALALIISFAAGLTCGLQIKRIADGLYTAIQSLQHTTRAKNTGVVRPGLNLQPQALPDDSRRSAVVRPRPPKPPTDDTDQALASVRNRTANK